MSNICRNFNSNNTSCEDILRAAYQRPVDKQRFVPEQSHAPVCRNFKASFTNYEMHQPDGDDDDEEIYEEEEEEEDISQEESDNGSPELGFVEGFDGPPEADIDGLELASYRDEVAEKIFFGSIPKGSDLSFQDWMLTLFVDDYQVPKPLDDRVRFLVITKEIAPTTKRVHYHIYVELRVAVNRKILQQIMEADGAHCEPRLGTREQAYKYCTKMRTRFPGFVPIVIGEPKSQGHRSDLDAIYEAIWQGATAHEIHRVGGSNALRYGNMIKRGIEVAHGKCTLDHHVLSKRELAKAGKIPSVLYAVTDEETGLKQDPKKGAALHNESVFGTAWIPEETKNALRIIPLTDIQTKKPPRGAPKKEKVFDPLSLVSSYKDPFKGVMLQRSGVNVSQALAAYVNSKPSVTKQELYDFYLACVDKCFKLPFPGSVVDPKLSTELAMTLKPYFNEAAQKLPRD